MLSLFKRKQFYDGYFKYNDEHQCTLNEYANFCCANIAQKSDFFKSNKHALQLQLAIDDFEVCSPLKSKKNIHKLCGIYMIVRNIPTYLQSRLDHILLVALCEVPNIKDGEYATLNTIIEHTVRELHLLETVGIQIAENTSLKGTLINFSFDNLGGNGLFGFKESFSSDYFCRRCECTKKESEELTTEKSDLIRTHNRYNDCVEKLKEQQRQNTKLANLNETKGIKQYCVLNNLSYYHIMTNQSFDILHDINEGLIRELLLQIISYCVTKKVASKTDLRKKIRDHSYGIKDQQHSPANTKIDMDSSNLGLKASQLYCVMVNLPFILQEYKNKLLEIWFVIESALKIMQIVFSPSINELDVVTLEREIHLFLENFKQVFNVKLIPKLHILTHYPHAIRAAGPLIWGWMMRFENKHKIFADFAKQTNNFKNITMTLSYRHQEQMAGQQFSFMHDIGPSLRRKELGKLQNSTIFANFREKLRETFIIDFLYCNHMCYRVGLMILFNSEMFEIIHILQNVDKYWFAGQRYVPIQYRSDLNSIEFEASSESLKLISFFDLQNKTTYEKKLIAENNNAFIKCETLELRKEMFFVN